MKDLIKRYLKLKIQYTTIGIKNLKRQEELIKQFAEITAGQQAIIEEYKDDSYKTKFKEEHKKFKEYEKESKAIIEEFTNEIKSLRKNGDK